MVHLKLLLLLVPGILGTQHFKKCKTFGSDLCFEAKIKEIVVKIGNKGTDDPVTVEFCGDVDASQCCTTPELSSLLSDDWSKNDVETWKAKKFGKCKDQVYKIKQNMLVTIKKSGAKDNLLVDLIDVYLISADKNVKDDKKPILERFQCKNYSVGGSKLSIDTKQCTTGPYHYEQIEKAIFKIGDKGTNDDVKFKIEADSNNVTCETKLDQFGNDWEANELETWLRSTFGSCKDKLYQITDQPTFSISKNGKNDLKVKTSTFYLRRLDIDKTTKYDCGKFELKGDCNRIPCIKKFNNCKVTTVASSTPTTTTAKPTTTKPGAKGQSFLGKLASKLG